jgi:hypothetical protein
MKDCFAYELNGDYISQKPWVVLEILCMQAMLHLRDIYARNWEEKQLPVYGGRSSSRRRLNMPWSRAMWTSWTRPP